MEACNIAGCLGSLAAVRLHKGVEKRRPAMIYAFSAIASSSTERAAPGGGSMFVFGMGFVGRYVSARLREEGWEVKGTCTSVAKKKELEDMGLSTFVFDATTDGLKHLDSLQHATHLLISIPPVAASRDYLLCLQEDLRSMLSCGKLQWLGYLSSTSVYGDCGGAWVNEDFPANPAEPKAEMRLAAEQGWLDIGSDLGISTYIFRLGGIYGPGRSALDTILNQDDMSVNQKTRESRKFTARIHVADIYQAIKASFARPSMGGVYNVVDDDPAPRAEVFAFARELIGERWPGMMTSGGSAHGETLHTEMLEAGGRGEKRVSNARLKDELGITLIHPSYRSGLRSILGSLQSPSRSSRGT